MKKFVIALMLCLTVLTSVGIELYCPDVAYAARPRNLLQEYLNALINANSQKAVSLLNEGLNISDATKVTFMVLKAKIYGYEKDLKDASTSVGKVENFLSDALGGTLGGISKTLIGSDTHDVANLSNTYVQNYSKILQVLKQNGANFSEAPDYNIFFTQDIPASLFKVILEVSNKKVFTGKEISQFLLCYNQEKTGTMDEAIKKLSILKNFGAKIDRSSSSDALVAKVLENVLPTGWINNRYLTSKDVSYLKKIYSLLIELGVNAGPRERSFWQVMSTKTPWEILGDYKNDHRNEPEILQLCKEIENSLPPVGH